MNIILSFCPAKVLNVTKAIRKVEYFVFLLLFSFIGNLSQEEIKPTETKSEEILPENNKASNNTPFDMDEMFRMEWIPGLSHVSYFRCYFSICMKFLLKIFILHYFFVTASMLDKLALNSS